MRMREEEEEMVVKGFILNMNSAHQAHEVKMTARLLCQSYRCPVCVV